jgi:hypothetical protein
MMMWILIEPGKLLERISKFQPKHKPWFDEGYSELLDQRKQAKLQWLQNPSEIDVDKTNNIKHKASRHFRNKKR